MPGFEEEAFARAQRISRPKPQREKTETPVKKPEAEAPEPRKKPEGKKPSEAPPAPEPKQSGLIDALFKDKEKSIILAIILLLSDESSDPSLLLALAYLLI